MPVFKHSDLIMSTTPWSDFADERIWSDIASNRILLVLSAIGFLFIIPDLISISELLFGSLTIERSAIKLEHSINSARMRNRIALFCIFPAAMIADRLDLYRPDFITSLPPEFTTPAIMAVLLAFVVLRNILSVLLMPRSAGLELRACIHHSLYNYFIAATIIASAACCAAYLPGHGLSVAQWIIFISGAMLYAMNLIRTGHFLSQTCGGFSTILYLCGLELVPVAVLIASGIVV